MAFTAYNNEEEWWILDKSIGELYFAEFSWGEKPDGSYFLPLHFSSVSHVTKYHEKFLCAKKEETYINGSYNSN